MKIKFSFFVLMAWWCSCFLFANTPKPPSIAVKESVQKAFDLSEPTDVVLKLSTLASSQKDISAKKYILCMLASYEELVGEYSPAAKHYSEAAWLTSTRDWSLVLDSIRCTIASGDTEQADSLLRSVLLNCFDEALLARARVYGVCIQLQGPERNTALETCRSYIANKAFEQYIPMLLFCLWWTENDEASKKILIDTWPSTQESLVVQGKTQLMPGPFWYLMERNQKSVAQFASLGQKALSETVIPQEQKVQVQIKDEIKTLSGMWQQTGFFKNLSYAEELKNKLNSFGFDAHIRSETRASGTTYYSVLVPETESRSTAQKLKDKGFESSLVID